LAVIKPGAAIETRTLFASPLLVRDTEAVILEGFPEDATERVRQWLEGAGRNDMQRAAEAVCAEVSQAASLLESRFGNSRMTGSGSAVFARAGFAGEDFAGAGAAPTAEMPTAVPAGWVGRMCRSLDAHPLVGWAED
jgi:4-diphosphocytidyl-2-C-methyl-D-erythritol kinase